MTPRPVSDFGHYYRNPKSPRPVDWLCCKTVAKRVTLVGSLFSHLCLPASQSSPEAFTTCKGVIPYHPQAPCAHVLFKAVKIFRENGCKPGKTPITRWAGWARWAPTTAPGAITKGMARYSRKTQCSPSATLQCAFEKSFCWRLTWRPPESFQVPRFRLKGLKGLHWHTGSLHIRAKEGPNSRLNDVVGPTFQDKSCQSLLTRWPGGLAAYSPHKPHPSPAGNELHVNVRKSHLLDVTVSWLHAPADMFKWFWYRPTKPIGRYVKYGINHMRIHCPKMPCNCLLPDGNNQHRKNGLRERESIHRPASAPHARVLDFNASVLILLLTAAQLQLWFSNMDGRQGPSSQWKYILHAILTWAVCLS